MATNEILAQKAARRKLNMLELAEELYFVNQISPEKASRIPIRSWGFFAALSAA